MKRQKRSAATEWSGRMKRQTRNEITGMSWCQQEKLWQQLNHTITTTPSKSRSTSYNIISRESRNDITSPPTDFSNATLQRRVWPISPAITASTSDINSIDDMIIIRGITKNMTPITLDTILFDQVSRCRLCYPSLTIMKTTLPT